MPQHKLTELLLWHGLRVNTCDCKIETENIRGLREWILRIKCQFIMEDGNVFETNGDSMLPYNDM